jgi:hypothetical protein
MKKELKALIAKVEAQGGLVEQTRGAHVKIKCADRSKCRGSGIVVLAGTASDHRSLRNGVSQLRRCGFDV